MSQKKITNPIFSDRKYREDSVLRGSSPWLYSGLPDDAMVNSVSKRQRIWNILGSSGVSIRICLKRK